MSALRLGIVGLGNWGGRLATTLATIPDVDLAACFARSADRRSAFAEAYGCRPVPTWEEFLAEPLDGVLVATPHSTHAALVPELAAAGFHLMVEKPLALTAVDARRCVDAAAHAGVLLQVAHFRRRLGATRRLKEVLDDGMLGDVHAVSGWFSRVVGPRGDRPWRDDPAESPLGGMTALGVHHLDTFNYLVGPVARVGCLSRRLDGPTPLDDITVAMFEFESGCLGQLGTSLRVPYDGTVTVFGSAGIASSTDDGATFVLRRNGSEREETPMPAVDGVRANLEAFVRSVRDGTPPETGGREGLEVVAVMEAMQRSAATGRIVAVGELRDP